MLSQVVSLYQIDNPSLAAALKELKATAQIDLDAVRSRAHSLGRRRADKLVKSCLSEGHFASRHNGPGFTALIFGQHNLNLGDILEHHCQNIAAGQNLLKLQAKTQLSMVESYCVKSYKPAKALTTPYAQRAWQGLLTLRFNGLPTAEPVALVVNDDRSSALVTGYLNLRGFDRFLYHDFQQLDVKQRYHLIGAYGRLIGRMHARGIYHADLKACNVLIDPAAATFYFIDTDRVESYASLSLEHRIKNLVQINNSIPREVAPPIRMHFMKCYSEETGDDPKRLFAKVWLKSCKQEILYTTDQGDQREFWR
ncbi:MAG: 3-deoxy-D-manno-octulosonic-acid kinase [Deltaproteobacteria bacterium ADurb.Bin510]|nr:MAG: 3-deoxy-D-manno-octulosonic-acid kinase [Deltaproteobacteria bacterium ADurb.Bin510]